MHVRLEKTQKIKVKLPEDLFSIMQRVLLRESRIGREREHFWVIGLAASAKIAYIELISLGSLSATTVTPLEVFNLAVQKKTPRIVLVHNHPGGSLKPSEQDKDITKRIFEGGEILGIEVLDHLIISEQGFYSFLDNGLLSSFRPKSNFGSGSNPLFKNS